VLRTGYAADDSDAATPPDNDPGSANDDDNGEADDPPIQNATLTLLVTPLAGGTALKAPTATSYPIGTRVTLTATPEAGYLWVGWQGDASGTANPLTVTLSGDAVITARFVEQPVNLDLTVEPAAAGLIVASPREPYFYGDEVTLTAQANRGYRFVAYSGAVVSTTAVASLTLIEDTAVTARFQSVPVVTGPANVVGNVPFELEISYLWGSTAGSNDRLELEESTSSVSAGFTVVDRSNPGERPAQAQSTLVRPVGIYHYRVRAFTNTGVSPYSDVWTVIRLAGPKRVRIVNDLPNNSSGGNDWGRLNQLVRVRIASTAQQALSDGNAERLVGPDTVCNILQTDSIAPGSFREFDTAAMPRAYAVAIEAGFWGAYNTSVSQTCWTRQKTMVTNCAGQCCTTKTGTLSIIEHDIDTFEVKASLLLAPYTWTNSAFCQ